MKEEFMKKFMEEYGFIALSVVVVVLLVSFCTPVGAAVKESITELVEKFTVGTNAVTDSALDKTKESHF